MPVVIDEFEAELTPDPPSGGGAGPAAAADAPAETLATPPQLQVWLVLRDLAAEREARLAVD